MLFKQRLWVGLQDGTITVTFRRWRRPQAKPGGRYRTPAGVLEVDAVTTIDPAALTDADAQRAGYDDRNHLLTELDRYPEGDLYRIEFHHAGTDPREALRADAELTPDDLDQITKRLDRLDKASRNGPWTRQVLATIADRPATRAGDLAEAMGRDTTSFKRDVRKLKEMGLTESLEVGYRLSPRGKAFLSRISRTSPATAGPTGA
jgi:hypothetical protein